MAVFSAAAIIAILLSCGIICSYLLGASKDDNFRDYFADVGDYPLCLGITIFATSAIYVAVPLENATKTPKVFTKPVGILNMVYMAALIAYLIFGILGYIKYGLCVESSVTFNLPNET